MLICVILMSPSDSRRSEIVGGTRIQSGIRQPTTRFKIIYLYRKMCPMRPPCGSFCRIPHKNRVIINKILQRWRMDTESHMIWVGVFESLKWPHIFGYLQLWRSNNKARVGEVKQSAAALISSTIPLVRSSPIDRAPYPLETRTVILFSREQQNEIQTTNE